MPIHPLVIHFPIALLVTSAAIDAAAWVFRRPKAHDGALVIFLIGVAAAGLAVITGDAAHDTVKHLPGIVEPLEAHEKLGFFTLWSAAAAAIVRVVARREKKPAVDFVAALLTVLCLLLLVRAAWFGGRLVYEHGAAVEPVMRLHPAPERPSK